MTFCFVCLTGSSGASAAEELGSFSKPFHRNSSVGAWYYNVEMGIGNNAHD